VTLKEACSYGQKMLEQAEITEAALDAWYLLEFVTGVNRSHYLAWPEEQLSVVQEERYKCLLEKRAKRIPLQHITGEQEFMGLPFCVNEHVLIPRQDTETLVEEVLKYLKPGMKFLDMCTGSGCILLSLMHFCPDAAGVGVDVSPEALQVAAQNRDRLQADWDNSGMGTMPKIQLMESDLFEKIEGNFDIIVSNPPYIKSSEIQTLMDEVRLYDPMLALDGHADGLYFYREITKDSIAHLKHGGMLFYEIGYDQGAEVSQILAENGFVEIEVIKDLSGLDRVVKGRFEWRKEHV